MATQRKQIATTVYLSEDVRNRITALRNAGVNTQELMVQGITKTVTEYEAEYKDFAEGVAAAKNVVITNVLTNTVNAVYRTSLTKTEAAKLLAEINQLKQPDRYCEGFYNTLHMRVNKPSKPRQRTDSLELAELIQLGGMTIPTLASELNISLHGVECKLTKLRKAGFKITKNNDGVLGIAY